MTTPKRYNTTEAADQLGVKPRTLMNWRHRGGGPQFIKIGRMVFYTEQSISNYIAARTFEKIGSPVVPPSEQMSLNHSV